MTTPSAEALARFAARLAKIHADLVECLIELHAVHPTRDTFTPVLAERILDILRDHGRPLKAILIAHKLGRKANAHFRLVLSGMIRAGRIRNIDRQGYELPAEQPAGYRSADGSARP